MNIGKRIKGLLCLLFAGLLLQAQPRMFTHMDAFDGLSDNKIQHILQLPDGRMVFTTPKTFNLYDGARFRYFTIRPQETCSLRAYTGAYHVYIGEDNRLWLKDYHTLSCFLLKEERYMPHLSGFIQKMNGSRKAVVDLFLDSEKTVWLVRVDGSIWNTRLKRLYRCPSGLGTLQDLDVMNGKGYFFFDSGNVACLSLKDGKVEYVSAAYPHSEKYLYDRMSLVVKAPDGNFYQLRNGRAAVCLVFEPTYRRWRTLLRTPYILHTLIVPAKDKAFVTCGKGLWQLALPSGKAVYKPSLQMVEGSSITTDINTVYEDRDGGWWLGTSDKGLLYGHPWRDAYLSGRTQYVNRNGKGFRPLLVNVSVDGKTLAVEPGNDNALLSQSVAFVRHLSLKPDQNTLLFDFSAMNYALPMKTVYRYRLVSSSDSTWHTVGFNPLRKMVDEKGNLHLPFSHLKPGAYSLQVSAASDERALENAPVTELTFYIQTPWWQTYWAYIIYVLLFMGGIGSVYIFWLRQKERKRKEQQLLQRIKELIERCNRYEAGTTTTEKPEDGHKVSSPLEPQDDEFLQKAVNLVKEHLNSTYSVEALSRDLCMERTGLYKKLTALLDQSPSLFIRNIRLQQAAQLLLEKRMSVTDIAAATGFSSSSYFSKCFQEMYGCKPSEYVAKQLKST